MRVDDQLNDLACKIGIVESYQGFVGEVVETNHDTKTAMLRANGFEVENEANITGLWQHLNAEENNQRFPDELIVQAGKSYQCGFGQAANWHIVFEEQEMSSFEGTAEDQIVLPPLPLGIGILTVNISEYSQDITIISEPSAAPDIESTGGTNKVWGINSALYGLRSRRNLGLGDYHDMATFSRICASAGADFVGYNPVHSIGFSEQEIHSPYSPSHRGFLDTRHIALDDIPGLRYCQQAQSILGDAMEQSKVLRQSTLVEYDRHRQLHHQNLEALYQLFDQSGDSGAVELFKNFCHGRGAALEKFSLYEAISEIHGSDWRNWSDDLRGQKPDALHEVQGNLSGRPGFHSWLQWIADFQITKAQKLSIESGMSFGLYLDLAVGMRLGGAEEWCEYDAVAAGVSLGAPPDMMNNSGQNWNIAGYAPQKLKTVRYRAFREVLREAMKHCGILRIDHILGLYRSFWIPEDGSPGAYIRQPFEALLAIVKMEAVASNTIVIGEDLGLVPEGFRDNIKEQGIYGYSVLQFEKDYSGAFRKPEQFRQQSLACFATHDTPTVAGYWKGADIDFWNSIGAIDDHEVQDVKQQRGSDILALQELEDGAEEVENKSQAGADQFRTKIHRALANSSAALVSIQLSDILGEVEAQNYPGTVVQYPNWRKKCSRSLEEIDHDFLLENTGKHMKNSGRGQRQHKQ